MISNSKQVVRTVLALSVVGLTALPAAAQIGGLGVPGQGGQQRSTKQSNPGSSDIDESTKNLRDEDPAVRLEAVKALAASQDKKAVEHLIEATADVDPRVKIKAIDALGNLRAADATPVLVQVLYMRESEPWLKQRVLVSLGKIGDTRSARPIADFLSSVSDVPTRGTAIYALGEIGDPNSVPELKRIGDNVHRRDVAAPGHATRSRRSSRNRSIPRSWSRRCGTPRRTPGRRPRARQRRSPTRNHARGIERPGTTATERSAAPRRSRVRPMRGCL